MRHLPILTRVVLENYKRIAFCDVKLGPLAILVGPNGAGKSNFLDALRFLSECMTGSVGEAFYRRSGFPHVLRRNGSVAAHLVSALSSRPRKGQVATHFGSKRPKPM